MDVNSINPVKVSLERPEPVVTKKGREKSQESADTSDKTAAVSQAELDKAIDYANESGKLLKRRLNFAIDDSTEKVVVKVVDEESGKIIRQVPATEMLRISAHLRQLREMNDRVMGAVKSAILDVRY
jgi:flagellar protein FlaG